MVPPPLGFSMRAAQSDTKRSRSGAPFKVRHVHSHAHMTHPKCDRYLAHKKTPTPSGIPQGPRHGATAGSSRERCFLVIEVHLYHERLLGASRHLFTSNRSLGIFLLEGPMILASDVPAKHQMSDAPPVDHSDLQCCLKQGVPRS